MIEKNNNIMEKRVTYDEKWLKSTDLISGHIYLIKDGRLCLYLGNASNGLYVFYPLASAYLIQVCDNNFHTFVTYGNYEWQIYGLKQTIEMSMQNNGDEENILEYKGIPKIYGEFPFVNYENIYLSWYMTSFQDKNVPVVASGRINTGFVPARSLIPGCLYYSGSCWRATYVYLGRTSDKRFLWYFIGNETLLKRSTPEELIMHADATKSNKKVKPLSMALEDKNAYIGTETKKLIESGYKVDMDGVTQQMINKYW